MNGSRPKTRLADAIHNPNPSNDSELDQLIFWNAASNSWLGVQKRLNCGAPDQFVDQVLPGINHTDIALSKIMSDGRDNLADSPTRVEASAATEIETTLESMLRFESAFLLEKPDRLMELLRPFLEERVFEKDSYLMRQGEPGDRLYVLVSGKVKIYSQDDTGKEHVIDRSGPGDVLGEMSLLTGESRSANVIAEEHVKAMVLPAETVHRLAAEHSEISRLMSEIVAKRLGAVEYDALSGKTLGKYCLHRRLGKGGMAVVYEATNPIDGQRVALKMMSHKLVYNSVARAKFDREFELVRSFNSPFIVKTYSRFEAFHTFFLVMEFCDGRSLDVFVDGAPNDDGAVREIYEALRQALLYAHELGVIHRDVKPSNMIKLENGDIKLMDFGLATPIDELSEAKGICGTVRFFAPELFKFQPASIQSDYFAAGMTLLELMLGDRFIRADNFMSISDQMLNWQPPDIAKLCPHASGELVNNVTGLLSPIANQRQMPALME